MTAAEQITGVVSEHGEGPMWDERRGSLLFVDMMKGDLLELDSGGTVSRTHVNSVLGSVRPRVQGGYITGVERGFQRLAADFSLDGDEVTVFDDPKIRMNDGGCDPQGRFYSGTMAYDQTTGAGTLYQLDLEGRIRPVLTGVTVSNGVQWRLDGTAVYYNDTPTRRISRFDFDPATGSFGDRQTLVDLPEGEGSPDGMGIDREGGVWIACWGGSAVRRYDERGTLTDVIELPVPNPTACAFGGADGGTLYITCSREGGGEKAPASGAVFAAVPGVTGAPPLPYSG